MPRQDVNQWDAGKTKDPRSVPRSLFLGLISLHSARTNFARVPVPLLLLLTSSKEFQGSLLSPAAAAATRYRCRRVSFFFLSGWLPPSAKTRKERERNWPALLSSRSTSLSPARSHSVFSSVVLALSSATAFSSSSRSPCSSLVLAAARWFVNAKFKLSRATLLHEPLCDANEGTNTSTLSKSPPPRATPAPYKTPKRAYQ